MSLAESIVRLLEPLPLPHKLRVLKEAEKMIVSELAAAKHTFIRKIARSGRSYVVSLPSKVVVNKRYRLIVDHKAGLLIYVVDPNGEISPRLVGGAKLPVPKGAWEEIGRPEYVVVEVLDDKIILMPA